MRLLTEKQKKVLRAIRRTSSNDEATLPAVAKYLNSSPTKTYPVIKALEKKERVMSKWQGHSLASIVIKVAK